MGMTFEWPKAVDNDDSMVDMILYYICISTLY